MPTLAESGNWNNQLESGLVDGINTLSLNQKIEFVQYVRVVLPMDGFVFWVRSELLSSSALHNTYSYNSAAYNANAEVSKPALTLCAPGSFHIATEQHQDADQTMAVNQVVFTAEQEIQDFNAIAPNLIYIGTFGKTRFAFSQRKSFYKQSGIFHYTGHAIYSVMESQIIDNPPDLDTKNLIVSNSLPIWLTLNQFMPMYPSFLVPVNTEPLFATVQINGDETNAIQSAPFFDKNSSHIQLVQDRVKIVMYGLRNFNALDFQDYINNFTLANPSILGVMNMPVIRDEKKTQAELNVIAMKKSITFDVNYYQVRINEIARGFIKQAIPTYEIEQAVI